MKEFKCDCGSGKFLLITTNTLLVDFTQEGGVEGCPHVTPATNSSQYLFKCDECGATVSDEQAQEMRREVI